MTARYVSAASVSALLHAVVIALLVMFSLQSRHELIEVPNGVFVILNGSTGSTNEALEPTGFRELIPKTLPPRPVVDELVEQTEAPVPVAPPRNETRRSSRIRPLPVTPPKPGPQTRPSGPPPKVQQNWQFEPSSGSTNAATSRVVGNQGTAQNPINLDASFAELRQRLLAAMHLSPGMRGLSARVEFFWAADGTLSRPKIVTSSGDAECDRAVLDSITSTRGPARPDGRGDRMTTTLSMGAER